MRTLILSLFVLCISYQSAFAQKHDRRERIKALKISYITKELNLTEGEAQQFWPVYNAYEESTFKIKHRELRGLRKQIRENLTTLTDAESQAILDKLMVAEKKLHEENTQLVTKLKTILSPRKIILLKVAEEGFNRKLFEEYRKKRHGSDKRK